MAKVIRVTVQDALLKGFDEDAGVRANGRSAVIAKLIRSYLSGRHKSAIARAYRRAYREGGAFELEGWASEAAPIDE